MRGSRRFWGRYSLRVFLLTILLAAVWLSAKVRLARNQELAVKTIESIGGRVRYDFAPTNEELIRRDREKEQAFAAGRPTPEYVDGPTAANWLVDRFGLHFFARVTGVNLSNTLCTNNDLTVLKLLPKLKSLNLRHVPYVTSDGLAAIRKLPLETLILSGNRYRDETGATGLDDDALANVAQIGSLKSLNLSQNRFSDDGLKYVSRLTKMETLFLEGTEVTGAGIGNLAALTRLRSLRLPHSVHLDDARLGKMKRLVSLRSLPAFDVSVTNDGRGTLRGHDKLVHLSLRGTQVTNEGLEVLSSLTELRSLDLSETSVSDDGLKYVVQLPSLESIQLRGTLVTDKGVRMLSSCRELARVDLSETAMGDVCLESMAGLPSLRHLDLRKTAVSDHGMTFLSKASSLRTLMLTGTKVSEEGLLALRGLTLNSLVLEHAKVSNNIKASLPTCRLVADGTD